VVAGLTAVPVDALLADAEAIAVIRASGARMLWVSPRYEEKCLPLLADADQVATLAVFGEKAATAPIETVCYDEVVTTEWDARLPDPAAISPDQTASIIFTSGTTGLAKGVMLTHRGIIANIDASIQSLPIYKEDVFMCVLPLHHTYPTTCSFLSPLAVGASVTICEKVVGKVVVDDTRDSAGSIMIAVPLLYDKLKQALEQNVRAQPLPVRAILRGMRYLAHTANGVGIRGIGRALFGSVRNKSGLASLRLLVAGGGPLNPGTADLFDDFGWYIVQGYGMSENGPLITTNTMKYKNNRSAGLVVKNTELRIDAPNAEGVGEIEVRSPSLMKGYFKNPEATADAFTADGWLKTGDLGNVDSDGYLFITGRIKNLIVTGGGKNVYPEEIEMVLDGSRVVKEVMVVGRRHARDDGAEEVVAVCVPDRDALQQDYPQTAGSEEFVRQKIHDAVASANKTLPPYKKIVDIIIRNEEFEKTSSRKIRRYLYSHYALPPATPKPRAAFGTRSRSGQKTE